MFGWFKKSKKKNEVVPPYPKSYEDDRTEIHSFVRKQQELYQAHMNEMMEMRMQSARHKHLEEIHRRDADTHAKLMRNWAPSKKDIAYERFTHDAAHEELKKMIDETYKMHFSSSSAMGDFYSMTGPGDEKEINLRIKAEFGRNAGYAAMCKVCGEYMKRGYACTKGCAGLPGNLITL